jgi:hypothetical protein
MPVSKSSSRKCVIVTKNFGRKWQNSARNFRTAPGAARRGMEMVPPGDRTRVFHHSR